VNENSAGVPPLTSVDHSVSQLYRAHASFVERVLRRSGVASRDLADATQDVFVVAHRKLADFEGRSSPRTWLYRIAWNVASEYRRRAFRRRELLDDSLDAGGEAPCAHEDFEKQRSLGALLDAIDRLEADKREALICHELEEQPMHAVAKRLGIPLKTAFSRLYAARRALRVELQRQGWACLPLFGWPFERVLDRGIEPLATSPLRWSVLAGRAIAAVAFVGLIPAEPTFPAQAARAAATPALAVVSAEAPVLDPLPLRTAPALARRASKARVRTLTPAAPPVLASTSPIEPDLTVIHAGEFDLGAGPFGESPLADPPFVAPQRHPRAQLPR
jgi:RNA polymerase sigma-70 factor, ECF subfamily